MIKTPEEMAEEYADSCLTTNAYTLSKKGFLAGYKAAQETYKVAIETFEEVAQQMMNEVVQITSSNDQEEK
jgi:hypothetical protein